jgi:hypothetical protein
VFFYGHNNEGEKLCGDARASDRVGCNGPTNNLCFENKGRLPLLDCGLLKLNDRLRGPTHSDG